MGVVVIRDGMDGPRVLLVKRGKAPRAGCWSIPGGRQQLGETLEEAARREVREETGLRLHELRLLDVVDSITFDDASQVEYHYSLVDFAAECPMGEAVPGSDAAAIHWAHADDLEGFQLWSETRRLIERALKRA